MRRSFAFVVVMAAVVMLGNARRADAVTVRDLIELSRAGLSDQILIALIDADHSVFTLDTSMLKQLKQAGVSDAVILAMIRTASPPPEPAPEPQPPLPSSPASPVNDVPPPAPVYVPVPVPVAVPVFAPAVRQKQEFVKETVRTEDGGEANVRVPLPPNCTKAEPVYWGFGGKLRPNSWAPPPTVVCR